MVSKWALNSAGGLDGAVTVRTLQELVLLLSDYGVVTEYGLCTPTKCDTEEGQTNMIARGISSIKHISDE